MGNKIEDFAESTYANMKKFSLEDKRKICYRLNYKVSKEFKDKGLAPHGKVGGKSKSKGKKK